MKLFFISLFMINFPTFIYSASKQSPNKEVRKRERDRKVSSFEKSIYTEKALKFKSAKDVHSFLLELKNKKDQNILNDYETRTLKALSFPSFT